MSKNGFTIVELLIVIVVIAVLAALTIIGFNGITKQAIEVGLKTEANQVYKQLGLYMTTNGSYPLNTDSLKVGSDTKLKYTLGTNDYCAEVSSKSGATSTVYYIQGSDSTIRTGECPIIVPSGYELANTIGGARTNIDGYTGIQPQSCPSTGGTWSKVPGNSLYNVPYGFCIQRYPAANVSGVATSQPNVNRWSAISLAAMQTAATTAATGAHIITDYEWMTMASNAAVQNASWSGGSVGSGTLPIGSASPTRGITNVTLSNGDTVYFDTGTSDSYYSISETVCYTGPNAQDCGIQSQYMPTHAAAYYTDQYVSMINSYGSLPVKGSSPTYFYGDPRYVNPSLNTYVTSARDKGLGYLRPSYVNGSTATYSFTRGYWNGSNSSGLFSLYMFTAQNYAHATYGFRVAK